MGLLVLWVGGALPRIAASDDRRCTSARQCDENPLAEIGARRLWYSGRDIAWGVAMDRRDLDGNKLNVFCMG
jgi:hypothetical protein